MKYLLNIILIFVMMAWVSSCEYKDLCYDHSHLAEVQVAFESNDNTPVKPMPMRLYLFSEYYDYSFQYDLPSDKVSTIKVPAGQYNAICMNIDINSILFANETLYDKFTLFTKDYGFRMNDLVIVDEPDSLWVDKLENICIDRKDSTQLVLMHPEFAPCELEIEIRNIEDLASNLPKMNGYVSGLAGGYLPSSKRTDQSKVTLAFPFRYVAEKTIKGRFLFWGHCPDVEGSHILYLDFRLDDNSIWRYTLDITERIHSASDRKHICIVLDGGLPLPVRVDDEGGGFIPTVQPVDTINIEIKP